VTPIETALSASADTFEACLANKETKADFVLACQAGQKPHVVRVISGMPGCVVMVICGREEHILPP
jgi:hypothetical protein